MKAENLEEVIKIYKDFQMDVLNGRILVSSEDAVLMNRIDVALSNEDI